MYNDTKLCDIVTQLLKVKRVRCGDEMIISAKICFRQILPIFSDGFLLVYSFQGLIFRQKGGRIKIVMIIV